MTGSLFDATPEQRAAMWERLANFFADQLVEAWNDSTKLRHVSHGEVGLAEFMGLTEEQYAAWVECRWQDVTVE